MFEVVKRDDGFCRRWDRLYRDEYERDMARIMAAVERDFLAMREMVDSKDCNVGGTGDMND